MDAVASRDLRNHTPDVLCRVRAGGVVAVTVRGAVVAEIHPPGESRPLSWTRRQFASWIDDGQADHGLAADLAVLAGDSTDLPGAP